MNIPVSISAPTVSSSTQGFVISVGLTEDDARRAGTSLERIVHALQVQLAAMLPAAQSRVTYLPAQPTATARHARPTPVRRQPEPGLVLDMMRGQAGIDGHDISLSPREYELLAALVSAQGSSLTRSQLHQLVWSGQPLSGERIVDVTVRRLRTRLRDYGQSIRTVRGIGYRFVPQPGIRIRRSENLAAAS